ALEPEPFSLVERIGNEEPDPDGREDDDEAEPRPGLGERANATAHRVTAAGTGDRGLERRQGQKWVDPAQTLRTNITAQDRPFPKEVVGRALPGKDSTRGSSTRRRHTSPRRTREDVFAG